MFAVCVSGFYSCSDDDDNGGDNGGNNQTKSIVGKWEVSNQNAEYGSFEFTGDNKYIITQRVSSPLRSTSENPVYIIVIFGDYSTLNSTDNNYTLDLREFGTIVINISDSGATITVNGETYSTEKAETVTETDKTKLLCNTWKESHYIYEDGFREDNDDDGYRLVFTTSGTYYFQETDNEYEGGFYVEYGTWEWTSDGNIRITEDETNSVVQVVKLTETEFVFMSDGDTAYLYR